MVRFVVLSVINDPSIHVPGKIRPLALAADRQWMPGRLIGRIVKTRDLIGRGLDRRNYIERIGENGFMSAWLTTLVMLDMAIPEMKQDYPVRHGGYIHQLRPKTQNGKQ